MDGMANGGREGIAIESAELTRAPHSHSPRCSQSRFAHCFACTLEGTGRRILACIVPMRRGHALTRSLSAPPSELPMGTLA